MKSLQFQSNRTVIAMASALLAMFASDAAASPFAPTVQGDGNSSGEVHAWLVGRLWNGVGQPIDNAVLVVQSGKIVAAGSRNDISIPPSATIHDHSSEVMIPGLVIAETSIGQAAAEEQAVTPQFRAADGLDLFEQYPRLLAAGITTVHVNPGNQRLMPGQSAVVKLFGPFDNRLLNESESLQIILSSAAWNPPTVYEPPIGANAVIRPIEPTQPQLASSLADAVTGLRALFDSSQMKLPGGTSNQDRAILGVIASAATGKLQTRLTARTAAEIVAAGRIVKDYKLKAVLVDPKFLGTVIGESELAEVLPVSGYVLYPSSLSGGITNIAIPDEDQKRAEEFWESARELINRGFGDIALGGMSNDELENIFLHAGMLKRGSISDEQILQILTSSAAKLLGVADRVGSLAAGKDADFVILSGDPFARGSHVVATYVGGESAFASPESKPAARSSIVRAGSIYTPHGIVSGGSVVVSGNTIAAVGTDVSLPPNAEIHDFSNAVIVPGMIDLNSSLGMGTAFGDQVQLNTTLEKQLVSEDKTIQFVRQSGITTALVGSTRMPTPVMAFKLTDLPRAVKDPVALRFDVNGNLTTIETSMRQTLTQGKAYADSWTKYDKEFAEYEIALKAWEAEAKKIADAEAKSKAEADAKAAEEAKKTAEASGGKPAEEKKETPPNTAAQDEKPVEAKPAGEKPAEQKPDASEDKPPAETRADETKPAGPPKPVEPKKPQAVENQEPWRAVFAGDLPVIAVAQQSRAIELAVKLFVTEFSLSVIIAGAEDADLALDVLKNSKVTVAIGPQLSVRRDNRQINLPQQLATAGIPFGFQSGAASGSSQLPAAVTAATYRGLGPADALRAVSSGPAGFLKLGSIGKLAAGQDADLVVLSGPPFDLGTEVLAVMIDGQWVFRQEQQ